jgi:type I restriction-modification system DNA methylase subunit
MGGQARTGSSANLGFEAKLWAAADALRNNMDAAEYKHVILGLIFLKYISDAFEAKHAELDGQRNQGADPEDPDEYRAVNIFWVPSEARWAHLKSQAPPAEHAAAPDRRNRSPAVRRRRCPCRAAPRRAG